ncbi:hypothetical protein K4L44_00690 [Halosquirtibacter laminarini]|uniref:Uncharacterized protein n=1 Tax=Halosquirtibacter laminarini TaxID=3374600 RepID=A0AC61NP06_9BACT|nr:hypothetical protein K4L44_00690 [Prolixibacteraceae bacterium]
MKLKVLNLNGETIFMEEKARKSLKNPISHIEKRLRDFAKGTYILQYDEEDNQVTRALTIS